MMPWLAKVSQSASHLNSCIQEPAKTAIQQIREKQYDLPYQASGKPIFWLGIVFDYDSRNVSDWKLEQNSHPASC